MELPVVTHPPGLHELSRRASGDRGVSVSRHRAVGVDRGPRLSTGCNEQGHCQHQHRSEVSAHRESSEGIH